MIKSTICWAKLTRFSSAMKILPLMLSMLKFTYSATFSFIFELNFMKIIFFFFCRYIQFMIHKRNYVFSVILTNTMKVKKIGMPENLSIWLMCLWLEVPVSVYNFNPYKGQEFLVHITFEIRFQST